MNKYLKPIPYTPDFKAHIDNKTEINTVSLKIREA